MGDNNTIDSLLKNFAAMADEEKEECIHCGKEWYKIHYKDGVCHSCQNIGKLGRREIARRKRNLYGYILVAVILLIIYLIS